MLQNYPYIELNVITPHQAHEPDLETTSRGDWKNPMPGYQKSCHAARLPLRTTGGTTPPYTRVPKAKGDFINVYKYMDDMHDVKPITIEDKNDSRRGQSSRLQITL